MTDSAYGDYSRMLCRRHAGPLLILASILLDDTDAADDIVAATIAAAARNHRHEMPAGHETRAALARSVYHRCLGHLATAERFPGLARPTAERPHSPFDRLPAEQRAMVALIVFGGHDTAQAAATLRLPLPVVAHRLELMVCSTRPKPGVPRSSTETHRRSLAPPRDARDGRLPAAPGPGASDSMSSSRGDREDSVLHTRARNRRERA